MDTGEELRAEDGLVVMDEKYLGFYVKMVNGTYLHTAGGYAEGGVLDSLQFLDGGGGGVREPERGGVGEEVGTSNVFRRLRQGEARETRDDMWGEKVNLESKVTPRLQGFSASGRR